MSFFMSVLSPLFAVWVGIAMLAGCSSDYRGFVTPKDTALAELWCSTHGGLSTVGALDGTHTVRTDAGYMQVVKHTEVRAVCKDGVHVVGVH